jgi:hypothetical protein
MFIPSRSTNIHWRQRVNDTYVLGHTSKGRKEKRTKSLEIFKSSKPKNYLTRPRKVEKDKFATIFAQKISNF